MDVSSSLVETKLTQFPPHNLVTKFPVKLWRIINECTSGAISWSHDGKSIYLYKRLFEEDYLRNPIGPFKTQSFNSFIRQLNLYGFQKVMHKNDFHLNLMGPDFEFLEYRNKNFRRGFPELIPYVQRRAKSRGESQEEYLKRFSRVIDPPVLSATVKNKQGTTSKIPIQELSDGTLILNETEPQCLDITQGRGDAHPGIVDTMTTPSTTLNEDGTNTQYTYPNSLHPTEKAVIEVSGHLENLSTSTYMDILDLKDDHQYTTTSFDNGTISSLNPTDSTKCNKLSEENELRSDMMSVMQEITVPYVTSRSDDTANGDINDCFPSSTDTTSAVSLLLVQRDRGNTLSAYPLQIDQYGQINVQIPVTLPMKKTVKNVHLALVSDAVM